MARGRSALDDILDMIKADQLPDGLRPGSIVVAPTVKHEVVARGAICDAVWGGGKRGVLVCGNCGHPVVETNPSPSIFPDGGCLPGPRRKR